MKVLLARIGKSLGVANNASLYIAVLSSVRSCIKKIGVQRTCNVKIDTLHISKGVAKLPKDFIKLEDIESTSLRLGGGKDVGFQVSGGMSTGHLLDFQKTNTELLFPNLSEGKVLMKYWCLPTDKDGEILIPDDATEACFKYCEYELLNDSRNTRDPKWQERRQMKQDAQDEINYAIGILNEGNSASRRTLRYIK